MDLNYTTILEIKDGTSFGDPRAIKKTLYRFMKEPRISKINNKGSFEAPHIYMISY